jgi:hypothetical protein
VTVAVLSCLFSDRSTSLSAEGKGVAHLFVHDALVSPKETAVIEARLMVEVRGKTMPAEGELLELLEGGRVLATATTDGSGTAKFHYTPTRRGSLSLSVRAAEGSRLTAMATTTVAAWERRMPILVVEMEALFDASSREPIMDAADELGKLTKFYYSVIYVAVQADNQTEAFATSDRTRQWLATHKFPIGYVLTLPSTDAALGTTLDELRSSGWTTIKVGVGRSRQFAETFLQRRLEVVIVPEPLNGTSPKKAKVAKQWKDVRKKL